MLGVKRARTGAPVSRRFTVRPVPVVSRPAVRRTGKSRSRNMRPKCTQATVYRYTRYSTNSVTQTIDTTEFLGYAQFTLDDVKSYTDFTNLYDQFKISHAQVHFTLITNPDATLAHNQLAQYNPTNWYPKIWWVYDSDDSSTISLSAMKERQGVKFRMLQPNKTIIMNVKPKALVQTYSTPTGTGYAPKRIWLDCATGYNVKHYGLKYVIDTLGQDPNDTYPFKVRVEIKYWLRFKGVL